MIRRVTKKLARFVDTRRRVCRKHVLRAWLRYPVCLQIMDSVQTNHFASRSFSFYSRANGPEIDPNRSDKSSERVPYDIVYVESYLSTDNIRRIQRESLFKSRLFRRLRKINEFP